MQSSIYLLQYLINHFDLMFDFDKWRHIAVEAVVPRPPQLNVEFAAGVMTHDTLVATAAHTAALSLSLSLHS